jgi:ATP-dependent Clp protease ATP-binding subunit ClpA
MFQRFNMQAKAAIERAWGKAAAVGDRRVRPEHLLASLAEDGDSSFCGLLNVFAVARDDVSGDLVVGRSESGAGGGGEVVFASETRRVMEYAVEEADRLGHECVGTSHFLLGLLRDAQQRPGGTRVLLHQGLELERVRDRLQDQSGSGRDTRGDLVPAQLFFELDRRARAAEEALTERVCELEEERASLRGMLELLARRVARLEGQREWVGEG